ncbi:unnamed protein product [Oncorhynchus mykiss]|uniref:Uncharacterized protein n=1 Tax=Oncorhynchus mykiss TaxID=8022 RepID=A0A060W417_ONCMY|nr:unnamed protein product [Oncorhynchus mykiss]
MFTLLMNTSRIFQGHLFSIFVKLQKSEMFFFLNDVEKLIHAFVTSRLDYCNALLSGNPDKELNHVQIVLNTATRILTRTRTCDHITPELDSTHWLPVKASADFKVLMPSALIWSCRTYLHLCCIHKMQASLLSLEFLSKQLKAGHSPIELHFYGIVCLSM